MSKKISTIKGIGAKAEAAFNRLGIYTIKDLLSYYPRDYDVYEAPMLINEASEGYVCVLYGEIVGNVSVINTGRIPMTSLHIRDETGLMRATWFRAPYLKNTLKTGMKIILRGKVEIKGSQLQLNQPEIFENLDKYDKKLGTLQPRYSLTKGVTNNMITKAITQVYEEGVEALEDNFEESFRNQYDCLEINEAVKGMHFPKTKEEYYKARKRFVLEEFIIFIMKLRSLKEETNVKQENKFHITNLDTYNNIEKFINTLPYELTNAQLRVWNEIKNDVNNPEKIMSRLVQGDVGSGKTIIALLSILLVVQNGYQGAMMAPTEVLAKQHFQSIKELFKSHNLPYKVELLTGSMTGKEKRLAYERISQGESHVIVGTHALIQEKVVYHKLAMVVTDEQHRFGVNQRKEFAKKGINPHILVMSATPIPRTLAIILYGDLEVSIIDELPANRLPIKNCVVGKDYQQTAYKFMKEQVHEGRQCYVICPMVEESEAIDGENVIDYAGKLQTEMGNEIVVTYLHGKMKQSQKDEIMEAYYRKEIHILVSTTVIEVGINVPNASTMLIENAERFGLSGLHQLRGRVGRGKHQSYCIFMSASKSKETKNRLSILANSNDGFVIANEDLKLRGPGDLFGIRQSGLMNFKMGDIYQDAKLLQLASTAIEQMSVTQFNRLSQVVENESEIVL